MSRSRASSFLYFAPFLAFVAWFFLPVALGRETLIIRDVLNLHLEMKWFGTEALRDGYLPLVDPLRGGGQPHLGNPNTVSLYPDNLLFLLGGPLWGLNAHFWLHLLLAPLSMFYLGRQTGLGRPGSWAAGVCFATGGYYLSTLNLYNLTAAVTLGPAFLAATIALQRSAAEAGAAARRARVRALVAGCLLWACILLGGDPMLAAALLGAAVVAAVVAAERAVPAVTRMVAPVGIGTLLAAPQLVEFLRIMPGSYRGVQGYSVAAATASSWSPANFLDWLLPLAYGKPDLIFWGAAFHGDVVPLIYTLTPGLVALSLAVAGTRAGWRWRWYAWGLVAVGFFFAFGAYNPAAQWLFGLPGMRIFRLPIKLWILAAIGLALAAGWGVESWSSRSRERLLEYTLLGFGVTVATIAALLACFPAAAADLLASWMPYHIPLEHSYVEVDRWLGIAVVSTLLSGVAWLIVRWSGRRRRFAVAALLALQCLGQGLFLAPLMATDSVEHYLRPSPLLDAIPDGARVVHGDGELFATQLSYREDYPDAHPKWLQRDVFLRLFPQAGMLHGIHYEFRLSPEGLDSFLTRAVTEALEKIDDPSRLTFLEAAGVTHLLLRRDLEGVEEGRVELVETRRVGTTDVRIYRLLRSAEEVAFFGRVLRSDDPWRTVNLLLDATFDPRRSVVVAGAGPPILGGSGSAEVVRSAAEEMVIDVEAESAGAVVVQRSYLPIWSATLDGEPAEIVVANMHRMAVVVPAGSHRLELAVDRGTLAPSFTLSGLALLLLLLQARRWRASGGEAQNEPASESR